eukprot:SAG11_NODE_2177_length_3716_cov_2.968482_2_plen_174_part_00
MCSLQTQVASVHKQVATAVGAICDQAGRLHKKQAALLREQRAPTGHASPFSAYIWAPGWAYIWAPGGHTYGWISIFCGPSVCSIHGRCFWFWFLSPSVHRSRDHPMVCRTLVVRPTQPLACVIGSKIRASQNGSSNTRAKSSCRRLRPQPSRVSMMACCEILCSEPRFTTIPY